MTLSNDSNNDGGIEGRPTPKEIDDAETCALDGEVNKNSKKQKSKKYAKVGEKRSQNNQQENTSEKETATVARAGGEKSPKKKLKVGEKVSPTRTSSRNKNKKAVMMNGPVGGLVFVISSIKYLLFEHLLFVSDFLT